MKSLPKSFKLITILLSIAILLQGCQTKLITLSNALHNAKPVNVISIDSVNYKFKRLEQKNGRIFGVTYRKSNAANQLSSQIQDELSNKRIIMIQLEDEQIDRIYRTKFDFSTTGKVMGYGVVALGLTMIISLVLFIANVY